LLLARHRMTQLDEHRPVPIQSRIALLGVIAWLLAVTGGLLALTAYDTAPGIAATAPRSWPRDSRLAHDDGRATLILVLHPHCPCSQASVEELAEMLPVVADRARVHVLVVAPTGTSPGWSDGDLVDRVAALPGVEMTIDAGGVEAARFGAVTSGQTYVFDPAGTMRFSGGLTPARGHRGDRAGRDAVVAALAAGPDLPGRHVFGCALEGSAPPSGLLEAWRSAVRTLMRRWRGEASA
jgi:hypothetical protein